MRPIVLLLLAATAGAQERPAITPPAGSPPIEVRDFTLDNGLAVSLIPFGEVSKASVRLVFRAGNVDESEAETWLGDLCGQLLELGSEKLDAVALARTVAGWGGELAVEVRTDQSTVGGTVLSEFAPSFLALIGDLVQHPRFPADELPRIKTDLVRNLNLMKSQPGAIANAKLAAVMYPGQAYGRSFPTEEQLRGYTLEQARAFFDKGFVARRAHLYVAGRFDAAAVERALREAFGGWREGAAAPARSVKPVSARTIHLVERTGAVQSTLRIAVPVVPAHHPDYVPLTVMNALLGASPSSRVTRNIRENKGYTYSPFSQLAVRDGDAYWVQNADVTSNVTGAAIKEVLKEIDLLRKTPPGAEELAAIQMGIAGRHIIRLGNRDGVLGWEQFVDFYGLPQGFDLAKAALSVTAADVRRMARKYLDPKRLTIVVVGDGKTVLPQLQGIARVVK